MTPEMELFLKDILARAWHTFYQTFGSAVVVLWASSGIGADNITDVASWEKLGLGLASAVLASLVSTIKSLTVGINDAKYADKADVEALEPEDEAALAAVKADPDTDLGANDAE